MRRLECVGGGSEKFWEGARDGVAVTVRWGRIGTGGQTKAKEFATEEAAQAHLDKLVAEKTKKGYLDAGTAAAAPAAGEVAAVSTPDAPPAPEPAGPEESDEDAWVVPSSWSRSVLPRRGSVTGAKRRPASGAAETAAELTAYPKAVDKVLDEPQTEPGLAEAARAYLAGEPDPLGAAVVAVCGRLGLSYRDHHKLSVIADAWVATHGVAFAAAAVMELSGIWLQGGGTRPPTPYTVNRADQTTPLNHNWTGHPLAVRVRAMLSTAAEPEYQAAVAEIARRREGGRAAVTAAFLDPSHAEWVADAVSVVAGQNHHTDDTRMVLCSLSDAGQLAKLAQSVPPYTLNRDGTILPTLVAGVGPAAAPSLVGWFGQIAELSKWLVTTLAQLPTDEAMQLLLDRLDQKYVPPAALDATRRFPVRAVRLLSAHAARGGPNSKAALELLRAHLLTRPELVDTDLPAGSRAVIDSLTRQAADRVPEADPADLPALLVDPPWSRQRTNTKAATVSGLEVPATRALNWAPGEEQRWLAAPVGYSPLRGLENIDWPEVMAKFRKGLYSNYQQAPVLAEAPLELATDVVREWRPGTVWGVDGWGRRIVARYGLGALGFLLHAAAKQPTHAVRVLLPVLTPEVAVLMAKWLARSKTARPDVLAWFDRHGVSVVPLLVPAAVGGAQVPRREAESALRLVDAKAAPGEVVAAARAAHGDAAADAVATLLSVDPLDVLPPKMPVTGDWADPGVLPQILVRGKASALPVASVRHVVTVLALCRPGEVYPGLAVLRETCDPESLARFAWAVFEQWQRAGLPSADSWVIPAQGLLGDDDTVRGLTPLIRVWPGEGGHHRAVAGLDVLAEIGSDVALMHLDGIARKVKFSGLKARAQDKIGEVAEQLGLSPDELADRLVPDLGLAADGSLVLDYGPRRFVVGFDEHLKPFVADEDGTRRKDLPKPGAKDDPELAPAAHKRFAGLKKDVRTLAADQIRRLEAAMVDGRRWSAAEFRTLFAEHPLLWHIVRRLVWVVCDGERVTGSFRLAEDRTLADAGDDTVVLGESAKVGIAHPLHLGGELATWSELFADYEILQPFPQLGRPLHHLSDDERTARELTRFLGVKVTTGKVLGLIRRGWERGEPQDAGVEPWLTKPVPGNRSVVLNLDPGLAVGAMDIFPDHTVEHIWLNESPGGDWWPRDRTTVLGELDPVTASELVADLTELTAP